MNFPNLPSSHFPETRRLDATFPSVLREEETWRRAHEQLGRCLKEADRSERDCEGEPSLCLPRLLDAVPPSSTQPWSERASCLHQELTRQISAIKRCLLWHKRHLREQRQVTMRLIQLAKTNPLLAADILHEGKEGVSTPSRRWWRKERVLCVVGNPSCQQPALPFSKYCLEHITLDEHQLLYRRCVSTDSTSSPALVCGKPVYNFLLERALCSKHAAAEPEKRKAGVKSRVKLSPSSKPVSKIKLSPLLVKSSPKSIKPKGADPVAADIILNVDSSPHPPSPPSPAPLPILHTTRPRDTILPSLSSSSWSSAESEEEEVGGTKAVLPPSSTEAEEDPLINFTTDAPLPPPLLHINLLPPDPTLHGDILDNPSSSNSEQ